MGYRHQQSVLQRNLWRLNMLHDPIIEEVRQIRHKIEAECENDGKKYFEHIQQVQEKYQDRLVRRGPKPALKKQKYVV